MNLKKSVHFQLAVILIINLTLFIGILNWPTETLAFSIDVAGLTEQMIPWSATLVIIGIVNSIVPASIKEKLVFLRWSNPLPGSRAFTEYLNKDPRIDVDRLKARLGPFPIDEAKQNALWYRLYKSVSEESSVLSSLGQYLLARDYTWLALMLLIILGSAAIATVPTGIALAYVVLLTVQMVVPCIAARNSANRLVVTVLAIKAAEET